MEKSFGTRLAELRKQQGGTQGEVARFLTDQGWPVKTQAVSKWEKDTTLPNAAEFLVLCKLYRVTDVQRVFLQPEISEERQLRSLPLYSLAVSAGTGQFLENAGYDMVEVGSEVSAQADFGVRIAGDSMAPRFVNGQIVWVRRQSTLEQGEIGIFYLNGQGFCKRLGREHGLPLLISLNHAYAPLHVREDDEFRVFGKVVG